MAGTSISNGETCTYHVEGDLTFNWDQPGIPLSLQLDIVLDSGADEDDDENDNMDGVGGGFFQSHPHPPFKIHLNPWHGSNTRPPPFPNPFGMNMENQASNLYPIKFAPVISEPETPKSSTLTHDGTSTSFRASPQLVSKKRKKELFKENEEENTKGLRRKRINDNPLAIVPFQRIPSNSSSSSSTTTSTRRSSLSSENSGARSSLSREERALARAAGKRKVIPDMQLALGQTDCHIRRPRNAFIYFVMCKRAKIVSSYLHSKFGEISRLLGQSWRDLPDTHKQYYRDMAEEDLIRYYDAKLRLESRRQRSFRMGLTRLLNRLQEASNSWISQREPQLLLKGDDDIEPSYFLQADHGDKIRSLSPDVDQKDA